MSGGSYNYLYAKEPDALFEMEEELQQMADRLAGLGYAADAAAETTELLLMIRQAHVRIVARQERLAGVWRAVEWWDSRDTSEAPVKEELARYRGDKT